MTDIHADSWSAWRAFQKVGGVELNGRDEGFEEELAGRLGIVGIPLETALRATPTDKFVRAFFDLLQPFVSMYRDILAFFESAGATEGRTQWKIQVDDTELGLEHFRQFLRWDSVECELDLPAVSLGEAWSLLRVMRDAPEMADVEVGGVMAGYHELGVEEIDRWLDAYRRGNYEEWSRSLAPSAVEPGYSDLAALGLAAVQMIQSNYRSRRELMNARRAESFALDQNDALQLHSIVQNETDFGSER